MFDNIKKQTRKCEITDCNIEPSYNFINEEKRRFCNKHKLRGMINIKDKRCKFLNCIKEANYNYENEKNGKYCFEHKLENMTNKEYTTCQNITCDTISNYNYEGETKGAYCVKHKLENMINIKKESKCKCGTRPCFGLPTDKTATYCAKCKTEDMIDLRNNKCKCGKAQPFFGLKNDISATCCASCKTKEMIDIKNKKCKCGIIPVFGFKNDKIAICCFKCKTPEMINVITPKCKAVDENGNNYCNTTGNKKYKGYCTHCFAHLFPLDPLTFQIRCKTKEIAVRDYINANYEGFHHDKPLWTGNCDCIHRRRIDHRRLINGTLLCVGTDEFQHKGYNKEDEIIRYDDLMMIHGGKFIYIRFNPDKYKENGVSKNPTIATRLKALSKEIDKQIKRIENDENTELLEIIPMYYDK